MNTVIDGKAKLLQVTDKLFQNVEDIYEKNKEAYQKNLVGAQYASEVVRALEGVRPQLRSIKTNIDAYGYNSDSRRKITDYARSIMKLRKVLSGLLLQA